MRVYDSNLLWRWHLRTKIRSYRAQSWSLLCRTRYYEDVFPNLPLCSELGVVFLHDYLRPHSWRGSHSDNSSSSGWSTFLAYFPRVSAIKLCGVGLSLSSWGSWCLEGLPKPSPHQLCIQMTDLRCMPSRTRTAAVGWLVGHWSPFRGCVLNAFQMQYVPCIRGTLVCSIPAVPFAALGLHLFRCLFSLSFSLVLSHLTTIPAIIKCILSSGVPDQPLSTFILLSSLLSRVVILLAVCNLLSCIIPLDIVLVCTAVFFTGQVSVKFTSQVDSAIYRLF